MTADINKSADPAQLSPATLAFIGDAVFELKARGQILREGSRPAGELHRLAVEYVRAQAQAEAAELLLPLLNEQEEAIYRRGRNSNSVHPPKSAAPSDYRRATGLEALFGWLYLRGEQQRIDSLFEIIAANIQRQKEEQNG